MEGARLWGLRVRGSLGIRFSGLVSANPGTWWIKGSGILWTSLSLLKLHEGLGFRVVRKWPLKALKKGV